MFLRAAVWIPSLVVVNLDPPRSRHAEGSIQAESACELYALPERYYSTVSIGSQLQSA
jgi:hypothetical protein